MRLGLGLGVNKGRKASGTVAEAAIAALESQAASDGFTAFSGDTKDASLVMVESLVAAGVWSKLDLFYVFATNGDSDFATYNWKDPSTFKATKNNNPTFTSLEGFTGNGSNMWLDCNFDPTSGDGDNYTLNSASAGYYSRSASTLTDLGIFGASSLIASSFSGDWYYRINSGSPSLTATASNTQGFIQVNRDASDSDAVFRNGSSVVTSASAPSNMPNEFLVLRRSSSYTSKQLSIFFAGGDLSTEASDFYSSVQTYMTSIGKQV